MHELQIIKHIVEAAENAAADRNINNVNRMTLVLGQMNGCDPEQFKFLFDSFEKGGRMSNTELDIEEVAVELECPECKHTFIDERFDDHDYAHTVSHAPLTYSPPSCPKCHADGPQVIRGQEMTIRSIDGE